MPSPFKNVNDYILSIPEDRAEAFQNLRKAISSNLPKGFEECISYGMIGYVVPHSLYPKGYHCNPKLPLPFVSIASQKNFIALYHMGMYADKKILDWFVAEYPKYSKKKLDMGKSCVRFKYMNDIPFDLIGTLMQKMSVKDWIKLYEKELMK
jgi:Domain of unknown function (DU1801)